jgi:hypothetical protein
VGGWISVKASEGANVVQTRDPLEYPGIPDQSIMFTTFNVYHLYKNLAFILNYEQPPSVKYMAINAISPEFRNFFYTKLCYQSDPDEEYIWVYCSIGFAVVIFSLVVLKIVSVLIDKGIIKVSKSVNSDEELGIDSSGITVHFSNSGTGMLTEESCSQS